MEKTILPSHILKGIIQSLKIPEEFAEQIQNNPIFDRCLGTVFGAMFGDALGSYCQFQKNISQKTMETVMKMQGGGTFDTQPGQVTDDSQMALHLFEAFRNYNSQISFDENFSILSRRIGTQYIRWVQSRPFDIGNTCNGGISSLFCNDIGQSMENLENAFKQIACVNGKSLSNGYLMRNTPMVIFNTLMKIYQPQNSEKMTKLIENQIKMTHSHQACLESGKQWVNLLTNIILRKQTESLKQIYQQFDKRQCKTDQFKDWKEEGKKQDFMISTISQGFAKIAVSFGLHHLRDIAYSQKSQEELNGDLYKTIIYDVIKRGGDTDTNGAIVGGLLGSIIGFRKLPNQYKQIQMNLRLKNGSKQTSRSQFYEPQNALYNTVQLFYKLKKR